MLAMRFLMAISLENALVEATTIIRAAFEP